MNTTDTLSPAALADAIFQMPKVRLASLLEYASGRQRVKVQWADGTTTYATVEGARNIVKDYLFHDPSDIDFTASRAADRLLCADCLRPVYVRSSFDGDSAWLEHGDLRAVSR